MREIAHTARLLTHTRLLDTGYNLPRRYLKKLIKNAAEIDDDKKPVFDLEFDIQLKKAVEVLDQSKIKHTEDGFYLEDNE